MTNYLVAPALLLEIKKAIFHSAGLLGHHQIPTNQRHNAQNLSREETFQSLSFQFQVLVDVPESWAARKLYSLCTA